MGYSTTLELVQFIEDQSNEINDGTSPFRATALSLLNRAHQAIISGGLELAADGEQPIIFAWAKSKFPKTLILETEVTGTVTATQDSATIAFAVGPTNSLADYFIRINDAPEVYRITAHNAASTAATLDTVFVPASVSAVSFKAFKLIYDITGILMPAASIQTFRRDRLSVSKIDLTTKKRLDEQYPLTSVCKSDPRLAGILKLDPDSGDLSLQLSSYPSQRERVQLEYIPVPVDLTLSGSNPIIPVKHRLVLAELALYYYQMGIDDDRATTHLQNASRMFKALVRDNAAFEESGNSDYAQLFPNENDLDSRGQYLVTTSGYIIGIY